MTLLAFAVFALALALVLAFAGNRAEPEPSAAPEEVEKPASLPEEVETQPVYESGIGLYIDGEFIAAAAEAETLESAVADAACCLGSGSDPAEVSGAEFSFANAVTFKEGEFNADSFIPESEISALLGAEVRDYSGKVLPVALAVTEQRTFVVENVLEHSTRNVYTDALYEGRTAVVTEGVDGLEVETYRVTLYNGVEISRELVGSETVVEPVEEVLQIGTDKSYYRTTVSIGVLLKPYDGYVSSGFGPRWGTRHNGIDIAQRGRSCYGDPVLCAADGVVIKTEESYSGYGFNVIVDHGDGTQTLYAHMSRIGVEVGQELKAGDQLGNIGQTGNTTGPHLHFEVRVDGVAVDPLLFVDYDEVIYD